MAKKFYLPTAQVTLAWLELEPRLPQAVEHLIQVLKVVLECFPHDDDVIQVDEAV